MPKVKKPHDNPSLQHLAYAEHLRQNETYFERRLWKKIRGEIRGAQVWRQTVVQGCIVDFYIPDLYLAIELDGKQHDPEKDSRRDAHLLNSGITTLRFKNPTTQSELNDIFFTISAEVRHRLSNRFPQFAQDLSKHQRGFLGVFKSKKEKENCLDNLGGNVEKPAKTLKPLTERSGKGCGWLNESEGICTKQIFASLEVAERMVRTLANAGVPAQVVRCEKCHRIHVKELR